VVPAIGVVQAVVLRRRSRVRYEQMLDRLATES
jgi:hypothetical protein